MFCEGEAIDIVEVTMHSRQENAGIGFKETEGLLGRAVKTKIDRNECNRRRLVRGYEKRNRLIYHSKDELSTSKTAAQLVNIHRIRSLSEKVRKNPPALRSGYAL